MRARLHEAWPLLAHLLHLYPDDLPRFAPAEWANYMKFCDDWVKANTKRG